MTSGGAFFEQFIEDYFSECDEHLVLARRALLDLEGGADRAAAPARVLELFRSLHTLKGLSGMVGLASAERVAHAMEEALRPARQTGAPPPPALTDALFASMDLLERCIASRRSGAPTPDDAEAVLGRLAGAAREGTGAAGEWDPHAPAASRAAATGPDVRADDVVYHFEFVPSRALAERGIGVESVRARLRAAGTLLDARPRVVKGGVAFDFSVAVARGWTPDAAWRDDGLRWTVETNAPAGVTESPPTPAGVTGAAMVGSGTVRVDLGRLDVVMRLVGDLVVSRSRLDELLARLDEALGRGSRSGRGDLWRGARHDGVVPAAVLDGLEETGAVMERQLRRLRDGVMRIRLVPIGEVFERLRFAIRDATRESGKQVRLVLHGQDTELDKLVVDRMLEPLLHLVRNAVSHGIEPPATRIARGKPAQGTVTLRAMTAGDRIVVHVEDDGAGIDVPRVEHQARANGLLAADAPLGAAELLDVLCAPGFSTRDAADRTSGRGVGMDVVRATVRSLGGDLALEMVPGEGTHFRIELPMTLMIVDALLVEVGDQQIAVPQPALREILQVERADIVPLENNQVIAYRGGVLPLLSLAQLFRLAPADRPTAYLLVVGTDAVPTGILVDRLVGLREVVVQPVTDPLVAVTGISGATELGDGRVSLILDSAAIVRMAHADRVMRSRHPGLPGRMGSVPAAGAAPLPS